MPGLFAKWLNAVVQFAKLVEIIGIIICYYIIACQTRCIAEWTVIVTNDSNKLEIALPPHLFLKKK